EHISNGCTDSNTTTPQPFNLCALRTCKAKSMVPVICPNCKQNFCFKHRFPNDHDCRSESPSPSSRSGAQNKAAQAALQRQQLQTQRDGKSKISGGKTTTGSRSESAPP